MVALRLLACFAHPDDEAFAASGVLAACTARGVEVSLVCTTRGEEGDIRQPGSATPETLGQVRHDELRRSCQALGLREPIVFDYRDSGWADHPAQYHPRAFVNAPAMAVIGQLVEEIRRCRPHVVLTFEPEGISGHKDHKAISRYTTAAFQTAGVPDAFTEHLCYGLAPYQPQRLFYIARPQGFRMHRATTLRQAGIVTPFPEPHLRDQGVPLEQLHLEMDVTPYLQQKLASMHCHTTQLRPDDMLQNVSRDVLVTLFGKEYLIQAHPEVVRNGGPSTGDMFAGIVAD